jgi:hypothetical protein
MEKHDPEKASPSHAEHRDAAASKEAYAPPTDFVYPTPAEEAAVIRKLDWRLMPIVFVLYMLSVLDRSNLGNAKLAGLEDGESSHNIVFSNIHALTMLDVTDINLEGFRYNWLGTIFYIAYITSQWLLMGWKHFKPHIWCASVVLFWGFVASIQATITSWGGLMACRYFLVTSLVRYHACILANDVGLGCCRSCIWPGSSALPDFLLSARESRLPPRHLHRSSSTCQCLRWSSGIRHQPNQRFSCTMENFVPDRGSANLRLRSGTLLLPPG